MNPFELARASARDIRRLLTVDGLGPFFTGDDLIKAICKKWKLVVKRLPPTNPLLRCSDANINTKTGWIVLRNDLGDVALEVFLCAHELGHYFLHRGGNPQFSVSKNSLEPETDGTSAVRYVEAYGVRERQELQANVFARELLLPLPAAREHFLRDGHAASEIERALGIPTEVVRLQLYDALLLPDVQAPTSSPVLKSPTAAQRPAVETSATHTLVEAGPGTGKTTTLLLRLQKLLSEGADPTRIVILTFSNKAARELVERLKRTGISGAERIWVGTFHAFGLEFLRKFGDAIGLTAQIPVIDLMGGLTVLEDILPRIALKHFDNLGRTDDWLPEVLTAIARCKDDLLTPDDYEAGVLAYPSDDEETQKKRLDAVTLYKAYETELQKRKTVDLSDLIVRTVRLMVAEQGPVKSYLESIQHVFVDEYQDVNRASSQLVKQLSKYASSMWAVGDGNQAIYAFMGASIRNITSFEEDFPGAVRIHLGVNHRSSTEITSAYHNLSLHNPSGETAEKLDSEKGNSGYPVLLVTSNDDAHELDALEAKVKDLSKLVSFSNQAVITFTHARAAALAKGLESRGLPVLFLGNIFERPEIKDLIRLMELASDRSGANLGSDWAEVKWRLCDADLLSLSSARGEDRSPPWWELSRDALSEDGKQILEDLDGITQPIREEVSPWAAVGHILLEHGAELRALCHDESNAAVNRRLAIWQFVHFCRTPDGIARFPTVKNLPDRIRRRIRLRLDRSLRQVPAEAEGLNALRVLLAHGSKGLEFDAVHFMDVDTSKYIPTSKQQWPLIPNEMLDRAIGKSQDTVAKVEKHNLFYVGMSRAREHLLLYIRTGKELPEGLKGICQNADPTPQSASVTTEGALATFAYDSRKITLDEIVNFKAECPKKVQLNRKVGRVPSGQLPIHKKLDIAFSRILKGLAEEENRTPEVVAAAINKELEAFELHDHEFRDRMIEKLSALANSAVKFYGQGGQYHQPVEMKLGEASVTFEVNQILDEGGKATWRMVKNYPPQFKRIAQALGVLTKTHFESTGEAIKIEGVVLADSSTPAVTKVQVGTIEQFKSAAQSILSGCYEAKPSDRTCPKCHYFFQCDQGTE